MLFGILGLSFWGYVAAYLIMAHITIMCVTLYLHRSQAHRGVDFHPAISHFCRFWLWLTTSMGTKEWVAVHRKHHARCETEEDPHSPQVLGLNKVLLEGAELYKAECKKPETLEMFGKGTPDDWIERNVYTRFNNAGIASLFVINCLLFGIPGITIWACQMMTMPLCAAGIINGVGHYFGYRNFECPDAATNIVPFGFILGGEELHNNHHTYGTSAKFSVKWWEFDLGWCYITALKVLGLAKVRRVYPKALVNQNKKHMDVDTLKALITNRFQVMARYSDNVIKPIFEEEKRKAGEASRTLLRKAKNVLYKERSLIDDEGKQRLSKALEDRVNLQKVYAFREKLEDIWGKTTATQKELLDALQEWCHQAEATGIEALRDFAQHIRGYTLNPVSCGATT